MNDDAEGPITIEVDLQERDMVVGERAILRRPEVRRARRFATAGQVALVGGLVGMGCAVGTLGSLVALVLLIASYLLMNRWARAWRQLHYGRPSSVTIDELGYTDTTVDIVTRVPWTSLIDIDPGSEHIVLRVAPGQPAIWPRRCFVPGDDERALAWAQIARQPGPARVVG